MRLNLESVSIAVGDRVLHHDLTLQVRGGESLAVMGPSGSGKSTLLAAIAGHWPVVLARWREELGGETMSLMLDELRAWLDPWMHHQA